MSGGKGTAADKFAALDKAGVRTVKSPADLGKAIVEQLKKRAARGVRTVGKTVAPKRVSVSKKAERSKVASRKKASPPAKKSASKQRRAAGRTVAKKPKAARKK